MKAVLAGLVLSSAVGLSTPDYRAGYELSIEAVEIDAVVPESNECLNCDNGKVGDGKVFTDCLDCGGDGILDLAETAEFVGVASCNKQSRCRPKAMNLVRGTIGHVKGLIRKRPIPMLFKKRCH